MVLAVSDGALDRLAATGFDPVYGARPLKRAIQQEIENPLAQEILKGAFGPGDRILAEVAGDRLSFRRETAAAA
jgi:ATP-dependent Clp protease ATP-binding subunit ClpB